MEYINFELSDNELNGLFNFNYNIDLLKTAIVTLINNQKNQNLRIYELESIIGIDTNKQTKGETNTPTNQFNLIINRGEKIINNKNDPSIPIEKRFDYLEQKLFKSLPTLEEEVEHLKENFINFKNQNFNLVNQQVKEINQNLTEKSEKFNNLEKEVGVIKTQIDDIQNKLPDLNIFEALGHKIGSEGTNDGGSRDQMFSLIQGLDKKASKKFELIDEKFKRFEEETVKLKNDSINFKAIIENSTRLLNQNKENIDHLLITIEDFRSILKIQSENIENNIKIQKKKMEEILIRNNEVLNSNALISNNNLIKSIELATKSESSEKVDKGMNKLDPKIKENSKRIENIENILKTYNFTQMNESINKLMEVLSTKTNIADTNDIKEIILKLNTDISFLKESITQMIEDRKMMDDIKFLRNKIENITASMIDMKSNDEKNIIHDVNKYHHIPQLDTSNFLDKSIFLDFRNHIIKELDVYSGKLQESKRVTEDIINLLSTKTNEKDLKFLEEYILNRLEDIKIGISKKFADKIETNKTIKYLDSQIKHIIDYFIKRTEKPGESWLIAKKPIEGYKCGSCESYIGDLQDKFSSNVWNKYSINPQKDPNDKSSYNSGNGFSRMLNMVNLETALNKNKPGNIQTSQEFFNPVNEHIDHEHTLNHKQSMPILPRVTKINETIPEIISSVEPIKNDIPNDPFQPKVTKIYKRSKNSEK